MARYGFGGVVNHGHAGSPGPLTHASSSATWPLVTPPTDGLLAQSDGRLLGGAALGDGSPVTLDAVPFGPVLLNQQSKVLSVGATVMPPWSHQKSMPFGWALPSGAWPILLS